MLLVISGDEDVFEWVWKALDMEDPSTGTSVPVLGWRPGGAAHDIWQYWGNDWKSPFDASTRKLPKADGKLRANYVLKATQYLLRFSS